MFIFYYYYFIRYHSLKNNCFYYIYCKGFEEGKKACCGSGPYRGIPSCGGKKLVKEFELCKDTSEYVFFDPGHCSEEANQQFAKLMWIGTPNVIGPHNLKALNNVKWTNKK